MPGMFNRATYRNPMYVLTTTSRQLEFTFEYEIHNNLEFGEDTCTSELDYDTDRCIQMEIENETIAEFGCTTPFGPNKTKICINQTVAQEVLKVYHSRWKSFKTKCKIPCRLLFIRPNVLREGIYNSQSKTKITLNLKEDVKITDEYFLYSGLSLIAEIGGYVGLFLGVSVKQISLLMEMIYDRLT